MSLNLLKISDWEWHTEADVAGISSNEKAYTVEEQNIFGSGTTIYPFGDASVLTPKALRGNGPRTYKDELHAIIMTWRIIYGKPPWAYRSDIMGRHVPYIAAEVADLQEEERDLKVI